MIRISVEEHNGSICSLEITGHSGSAERGKDLVCAAVSGIAFGLCNAMDILAHAEDISVGDNLISIKVSQPDEQTDLILKTGLIQLETVAEQNRRFIKVYKLEV